MADGTHNLVLVETLRRTQSLVSGLAGRFACRRLGVSWSRLLIVLVCTLLTLPATAADILGFRHARTDVRERLVIDLSGPAAFRSFSLVSPPRVVLDLSGATLRRSLELPKPDAPTLIQAIRHARRGADGVRVVLDLAKDTGFEAYAVGPDGPNGHRLVIDLPAEPSPGGKPRSPARPEPTQDVETAIAAAPAEPVVAPAGPTPLRDIVIAIDAGHGGKDTGAIGRNGTREKDIVLEVARRLKTRIDARSGISAIMVREGDTFVRLRDRMRKAREHRADLFVSIHADAFKDPRVRGASVYVLSESGASSEAARWLAERENASDHIGHVQLQNKDRMLQTVLLDLSQTAVLEASIEVADAVLSKMKQVGKTHKRKVQHANFAVLKSPDIPSLLVETAFISNPQEEKRLRSSHYQDLLADAIAAGIYAYFEDNAPPNTLLALKRHRIRSGETLTAIARRYSVPVKSLKVANDLSSDLLRPGDVLTIP